MKSNLQASVIDQHMATALRYFLDWKGWRVSDLASAAGISVGATSAIVKGHASPRVSTLGQLCEALGVPPWLFWWVATSLSLPPTERTLKDYWPDLESPDHFNCRRGFELVKEGITLMMAGSERTEES